VLGVGSRALRDEIGQRLGPLRSLPARARWLIAVRVLSGIGQGLAVPFVIVYLRDARHLPLSTATAVIAMTSAAALVGGIVTGAIIDRTSTTTAAVLSFGVAAAGCVIFVFAVDLRLAMLAGATLGIGVGGNGGVWNSFIGESVPPAQRTSAFGLSFAALNASIGFGGLIAGLIVQPGVTASFQLIYAADAVTLVACACLVVWITRAMPARVTRSTGPVRYVTTGRHGYAALVTDRVFGRLLVLVALLNVIGYGQFGAALPAYATRPGGVPIRWLALVYAVNTFAVIVLQVAVLPLVAAIRRTSALAWTSIAWGASWLLVLAAGMGGSSYLAGVGFLAVSVLFALGEVLFAPAIPALVNDIASDEYRGRYNSAAALSTTVGMIIGPLLAGVALQAGRADVFFIGLAIGCLLMVPAWSRLSRILPPSANGVRWPAERIRKVG
jgi:MFS family permease